MAIEQGGGIHTLEQVAATRAPARTRDRLHEAHTMVGDAMQAVEFALGQAVATAASPGRECAAHLLNAGGKRIRPLSVLLAASAVGVPSDQARELAVVAELVHLATLLHDDVIDDGSERRGVPTARRVWGNAVSVLAGDHLLMQALHRTARVAAGATFEELLETLKTLVAGEIVQLRGRTTLDLTRQTYERVAMDKTASLFSWSFRAGARSAGATEAAVQALGSFGTHLGLAFQIVDDVLDYAGDPLVTGKSLLADAAEGKVTLPLIFAAEADAEIASLLDRARAGDMEQAQKLGARVLGTGACDRSRREARCIADRAHAALAVLPQSPALRVLSAVCDEVVSRAA